MLTLRYSELIEHFAASHALGKLPSAMLIAGSRLSDKEQLLEALLFSLYPTVGERIGNHFAIAPLSGDEKIKTKTLDR